MHALTFHLCLTSVSQHLRRPGTPDSGKFLFHISNCSFRWVKCVKWKGENPNFVIISYQPATVCQPGPVDKEEVFSDWGISYNIKRSLISLKTFTKSYHIKQHWTLLQGPLSSRDSFVVETSFPFHSNICYIICIICIMYIIYNYFIISYYSEGGQFSCASHNEELHGIHKYAEWENL